MQFNLVFEQFDCSDANAGARWNECIDDLELYLVTYDVTAQEKTRHRAALLNCGSGNMRRNYGITRDDNSGKELRKSQREKFCMVKVNKDSRGQSLDKEE